MLVSSTARLRFLSIPPRKMRLVADNIKGLPVEKALAILNFTPKIAARHLAKSVKSAAANALSSEGTDNLHPEDLVVKNIIVDAAPTQKRIRFRSMGRVFRVFKRHCHVTVYVEGHTDSEEMAKPAASKAKKEESAKVQPAKKKTAKKKTAKKKTAGATKRKTSTKAKASSAKKTVQKKTVSKGNK